MRYLGRILIAACFIAQIVNYCWAQSTQSKHFAINLCNSYAKADLDNCLDEVEAEFPQK